MHLDALPEAPGNTWEGGRVSGSAEVAGLRSSELDCFFREESQEEEVPWALLS